MTDTEKRLQEIEERAKKATEEPWENDYDVAKKRLENAPWHYMMYIGHAREDIPWLIQRVRELESGHD